MIPLENQIFRLIFPPSGSIPLEKIEAVPLIRQHIDSIIDLASTEHGIVTPGESAALTARIIELRDTPGPDGKVRTWRTIAEICGTTLDAVRHRYSKATIRKSLPVQPSNPPTPLPEPYLNYFTLGPTGYPIKNERVPTSPEEFQSFEGATALGVETPTTEKPVPIPTRLTMCGDFTTVRGVGLTEKPIDAVGVGFLGEPPEDLTPCQRGHLIGPKIPHELDDELIALREAGTSLKDVVKHLDSRGIKCTEADVSARVLSEQRKRAAAKKAEEAPVQEAAEPVSISRKELDLRIWDMWRAGKTLDEISDILYSEGLYYSAKSVRVRLLSQGAKL